MAVNLRFIKSLSDKEPSITQIMNSIIMGNTNVQVFQQNTTYQDGDLIYYTDPDTGEQKIYVCKTKDPNGITVTDKPDFESGEWKDYNVIDNAVGGGMHMSTAEPEDKRGIWLKARKIRKISVPANIR